MPRPANNIPGMEIAVGGEIPSRASIFEKGLQKIDDWAGTVWNSGNYPIEESVWDGFLYGETVAGTCSIVGGGSHTVRGSWVKGTFNLIGTLTGATGSLLIGGLPKICIGNSSISIGVSVNFALDRGYIQHGTNFIIPLTTAGQIDASTIRDFNVLLDFEYKWR